MGMRGVINCVSNHDSTFLFCFTGSWKHSQDFEALKSGVDGFSDTFRHHPSSQG